MSKLAAGQDGREAQSAELQRGEEVDQNPIIVVDDEQPQIGQSSSTHDDSGIAPPAAAPKMFSLFQPGVRDPGTLSSSSTSRSSRGRAAKDKKVDYSDAKHAKAGLEDEEGDFQVVGSSSTAAPPAPKRGRPRKKAVSPAPPPPKAPSPAPLPPLSLNVKGNAPNDAPVHSFFAPKASAPASTSSSSTTGHATTLPARAPKRDQRPRRLPLWPDRENIHVQPPGEDPAGSLYAPRSIPFETIDRKGKGRAPSIPQDNNAPLPLHGLTRRVQEEGCGQPHATSSSSTSNRQPPSSLAWTDQWRPNRADDVLNNEDQARYLRDWMRELEVTTSNASRAQDGLADIGGGGSSSKRAAAPTKPKQPRVQTSVPKAAPRKQKRRRRGGDGGFGPGGDEVETLPSLDDFIVYDDEYEDDAADYVAAASGSSSSRLTNCIVLTGPSGAGKTAAVYACATELNFEVFELFPGMGKRGAKELHQAVGDLARNHMVSGGGSGGGAMWGSSGTGSSKGKSAFDALMKAPAAGSQAAATPAAATATADGDDEDDDVPPANSQSSDDIIPAGRKRIHLKGRFAATTAASSSANAPATASASAPSSSSAPAPAHALASSPAARQSLILIEEVDVLSLEEDRSFWSGVIDLVASSRRPIVLTCNDVSAVPLADLPVQEVLRFQRPTGEAVERHLGEKVGGGKEAVKGVLEAQAKRSGGGEDEGVDLRQAILQLQFARGHPASHARAKADLVTASNGETAQSTPANDLDHLRSAYRSLNATSFALAHLSQPFTRHAAEQVAPGVPQSLSVSGGGSDEASPAAAPAQPRVQTDGRSSTHRPATPEPSTESDTLLLQSFTSSRPQVPRSLWAQVSASGQGYVALPEQSSRREREVLREVQVRASSVMPSLLHGDLHSSPNDEDDDDAALAFNKSLFSAQQTLLNLVAPISPLWLRLARHLATSSGSASSPVTLPSQLILDYAPMLRAIVRIEDAEQARMKHLASILGVGQQEAAATAAADQQAAAQASSSGATAPPRRVLRSGNVIGGPGGWERTWTLRWHKREDYDGWYEDVEEDEGIVDGCEMARRSGEAFGWGSV